MTPLAPKTGDTVLFSQSADESLSTGKFIATIYAGDKVRYLLEMPDGALLKVDRNHCTVHSPETCA